MIYSLIDAAASANVCTLPRLLCEFWPRWLLHFLSVALLVVEPIVLAFLALAHHEPELRVHFWHVGSTLGIPDFGFDT